MSANKNEILAKLLKVAQTQQKIIKKLAQEMSEQAPQSFAQVLNKHHAEELANYLLAQKLVPVGTVAVFSGSGFPERSGCTLYLAVKGKGLSNTPNLSKIRVESAKFIDKIQNGAGRCLESVSGEEE